MGRTVAASGIILIAQRNETAEVRRHLHNIPARDRATSLGTTGPVKHAAAGKWPPSLASRCKCPASRHAKGGSRDRDHDPVGVGGVEMKQPKARAQSCSAYSNAGARSHARRPPANEQRWSLIQQAETVLRRCPGGRNSSALADTELRMGGFRTDAFQLRHALTCPPASFSGVVRPVPRGTNWRSSSQMRQRDGGSAVSGYEVPQAQQIWIGIEQPFITDAGKPRLAKHVVVHSNTTPRSREPSWSSAIGPHRDDRRTSVADAFPETLNEDDCLCVDDLAGGNHGGGLLQGRLDHLDILTLPRQSASRGYLVRG